MMRWIFLILFEIFVCNIHFMFSRDLSIFELQPVPLLILAIFLLMKLEEEHIFKALLITGIITDIFYSRKIGCYTSIYLLSGLLLVESRNMLFRDHFVTHLVFVFIISFIGILLLYAIDGNFTLRAPLFIAIYNAVLTPFFYFVFDSLNLTKLLNRDY